MAITFWKLLSLAIACAYFVAALSFGPRVPWHLMLLILLAPLALIWFPERLGTSWPRKKTVLGNYEPVSRWSRFPMRDSPPTLVALMGWLFLLGLPVLYYWITTRSGKK
jgi:hypothetical protein